MLSVFKSEILTPIQSVSSLLYNGIFAKDQSAILIMNARRDSNRKSQGTKINVGNGLKKKKKNFIVPGRKFHAIWRWCATSNLLLEFLFAVGSVGS